MASPDQVMNQEQTDNSSFPTSELASTMRRTSSLPLDATPGLQLASELAGMLTWELDPETETVRWSPEAERVLGRTPPGSLTDILACLHPDDRKMARGQLDDLALDGGRIDMTARVTDGTGKRIRYLLVGMCGLDLPGT